MGADRVHDLVLLGATGFTGELVAGEIARRAPEGSRWALAGRNAEKLKGVAERLGVEVPLLTHDSSDRASMRELAESARVVVSTVGPYALYGEELVAACAEAGTGYLDLTGEPEFVDRTWLRHHGRAQETGARLVHACGFDSIPHDLGVLFTVARLPDDAPLRVEGFVSGGGSFSGGTFASALGAFERFRQTAKIHQQRRKAEEDPPGRRIRVRAGTPHRASDAHAWALPMPTVDPQIVAASARARPDYGPDFTYTHYAAVERLPVAVGLVGGVAALFTLAQIPPARPLLAKIRGSGSGPTPEQRAKGWFRVRVVGEGGGRRVVSEVSGGDPGYGATSVMLAEAALCLAHDDLPETAGQVTTAAAMGEALIARLDGDLTFRVVE